ncbi:MAG TPA: IS630 family transposase, partial [Stellaceae bacterium]|nr:IS630 family transposase [Stellaceae bacterium]
MSTPVPLRSDFDTIGLRMLARRSRDPDQTRRLLALAEIYDGGSRPDAARIGGVGVQIVRDWVVRFNAKGPDGLLNGKAPGARSILDERQRRALRQAVEDGPIPALHGVVRWRLIDLAQWLFEEFRVSISKPTLSRELRHMGFRKLSARPRHHGQDEEAAAAFKKTFSPVEETAAKEAPGKPIEIWFQDEARIGQKNKVTRRWAKRGTRPSAPHDQRTSSAYIFGAICPAEGKGAGLVLPSCNSEAMALHLEEISLAVAPGAHAILLLDQAGWHVSKRLSMPDNITLLPLPPKSPELNPVENIWQFMRDNWLSNRVFKSYDDILDHCC